jgi:hypothetical protein
MDENLRVPGRSDKTMNKGIMAQTTEADQTKSPEDPPNQDADPQEAYSQFTVNTKRYIVAMGSLASFFSPLSSSIYLPALTTIANELHISTSQVNLTVTTYLVSRASIHAETHR